MASKKCPSCGKKVAPKSSYCIYCATRFDDVPVQTSAAVSPIIDFRRRMDQEDVLDEATQVLNALVGADESAGLDDVMEESNELAQETTVIPSDDIASEGNVTDQPSKSKGKLWLILSIIGLILIAVVATLFFLKLLPVGAKKPLPQPDDSVPTQATVSPERQAWLDSFLGAWVDEQSVGKKDLIAQGGQMLVISDITDHVVTFELYAHSGGDAQKTAFVAGVQAVLYDDTLHFTFDNDALQNAGEGFIQLHDDGINVEVLIKNIHPDQHSLGMNTVFKRQQLPTSKGMDIRMMKDASSWTSFGELTGQTVNEEDGSTKYSYGAITTVVNEDQSTRSIAIDYTKLDDPSAYCYECVDGTMTYETVKTYFGEAEQDYEELDTQMFLLHYPLSEQSSVTFTFDSTTKRMKTVTYFF